MTLVAGNIPTAFVSASTITGGDLATTWSVDTSGGVSAAGLPGSQVTYQALGPNEIETTLTPPSGADSSAAAYAASGRSVYWEALATGVPAAVAAQMTLALGDSIPAGAASSSGSKGSSATTSAETVSPDSIFNSGCAHDYFPNTSKKIWGEACIQQSFLEDVPGSVYVENQVTTTGDDTYASDSYLTYLEGDSHWPVGVTETRVGWSPSGTINEGSPTLYTLMASYDGLGGSIQEYQYPATLSPYYPSGPSDPGFGSDWEGYNQNTDNSANNVDIVHIGPGSTNYASVSVVIEPNNE
jgi:hypothetical protein